MTTQELQNLAIQNKTQFNYKLPSGEIIKAGINPSEAATIDLGKRAAESPYNELPVNDPSQYMGKYGFPAEFWTAAKEQLSGKSSAEISAIKTGQEVTPIGNSYGGAPSPAPVLAPGQFQTPNQLQNTYQAAGLPVPEYKPATPIVGAGKPLPGGGTNPVAPASSVSTDVQNANTQAQQNQQSYFNTINNAAPSAPTDFNKYFSQIVSMLSESKPPTAPSMVEQFNTQRANLGVGTLEGDLNNADAQLAKLEADYNTTQAEEGGRLVSMEQIRKRQSALGIEYTKQKGELEAKRTAIANQLNMKYGVLNTMMTLTGQDYQNANQAYQQKISNAISLTNLIQGISQDQKNDAQKVKDNARANIQIYQDLITSGSLDYNTLSDSVKLDIKNAELQSGLPVGITSYLTKTIKDPIVTTLSPYVDTNGNNILPVVTKGANGSVSISTVVLPSESPAKKLFSEQDKSRMSAAGLDETTASNIYTAIMGGESLDEIRGDLKKLNKDPSLLDIFDRVIGIKKILGQETGTTIVIPK